MMIISKLKACLAILFITTPALIVYFSYMLDMREYTYQRSFHLSLIDERRRYTMIGEDLDDGQFEMPIITTVGSDDFFEPTTPGMNVLPVTMETETATRRYQLRTKFLLPVLKMWGGGNNVQFQSFKNVIMFALYLNRTVVLTPFYEHGGHARDGYTLPETLRLFEDTFDVDRLRALVPVATVEEYRASCPEMDFVLFWNTTYWEYTSDLYQDNLNIDLPPLEDAERVPPNSWEVLQRRNDELPCVGYYDPHRYTVEVPQEDVEFLQRKIDRYLVRALHIKQAADRVLRDVCNGKPYMALHYRNKTGEGCHFFLDVRREQCALLVPAISEAAVALATTVANYMVQHGLECLYVAHPLWSSEIIKHLSAEIPRENIYDSRSIYESQRYGLALFKSDMYFLSLLEEEICLRADAFIGSMVSNWSKFVVRERESVGRGNNYMLKQTPSKNIASRPLLKTSPSLDIN
ncbi:uncharacterized protein [Ptychodera flava]|uniref:uncharacterized protein n=1 Tax=Ptychodera flava TaxID=63121 RepID=UPI00396AA706